MLNEVAQHDNQTQELATVNLPDSHLLAQLLSESGVTADYKAPTYNETIDMLFKQFGDKDGLIKIKDMAMYVGEFDPNSASYFSTDFKLT